MKTYEDFLAAKVQAAPPMGFDELPTPPLMALKPHQAYAVRQALRAGRYAIFADCGLGKTLMLLELARQVYWATGMPVLVVAPLSVTAQIVAEAERWWAGLMAAPFGQGDFLAYPIHVVNYEQVDKVDTRLYAGVVLDEASILKNYAGKLKQRLCRMFSHTRYRLTCTATPSPNATMELTNQVEFLGIMPPTEVLMRWFINDTMHAGAYRLKKHAEADFWRWVSTWALCISRPSDLGYDDEGYVLPPLHWHEHPVQAPAAVPTGQLFEDGNVNATDISDALRRTLPARLLKAAEIVEATPGQVICWVSLDEESRELAQLIGPESVEVRGSEKAEAKAAKLLAFARGEARVLITKKRIAGYGMNFQRCATHVFVALDFSFEQLYQAIRRSYRFGQTAPVHGHLITSASMANVAQVVADKQARFDVMRREMSWAVSRNIRQSNPIHLMLDYTHQVAQNQDYTLHLGDCIDVAQRHLADNSVDFSIFSPPFSNLYTYSDSVRDMGNTDDDAHFQENFRFLLAQLHRVLKPGRLVACHVKNMPKYKTSHGVSGLRDFRGDCIRSFEAAGFVYHSEVCIWIDPVLEMQRTKAQRLLYKQLRTDATLSGQGTPEYLIVFRKWEGLDSWPHEPVRHDAEGLPLELWQQYASPVWMDIRRTDVLNGDIARQNQDEKHICPLQLEVIRRSVDLWTNPGDVVFSPFAGIGSEGYVALQMRRRFVGIELKESYWNLAQRYLNQVLEARRQQALFSTEA